MKRILRSLLCLLTAVTLLCTAAAEGQDSPKQVVFRNEENRSIELSYVDEDGNLVNGPAGYATVEYLYEDKNIDYPTKIRFLDKDGERVVNEAGYSVAKYTYNKKSETVGQIEFYNAEGKEEPIEIKDGKKYVPTSRGILIVGKKKR